jgi:rhizosphere induced protein
MGQPFYVTFVNNSTNQGDVCLFQQVPNAYTRDWVSLAWFSKKSNSKARISFTWTEDYSFQWAQTGVIQEGIVYRAIQNTPADLTKMNQITFDKNDYGYLYTKQITNDYSGELTILTSTSIPNHDASVVIGMSGNGAFAKQATPNSTFIFEPNPQYFITFGVYQEGVVVDTSVQYGEPHKLTFPPDVYVLTATLNQDNTWIVSQDTPSELLNSAGW